MEPTTFESALDEAKIELPEDQRQALQRYAELVWQYNEHLNLTRHTTWRLFVGRDLADSLHLAEHLEEGEEVLDLGSGSGVPGIPLAILRPDLQVSLVESVGKRAKVLGEIVDALQLPVPVYAARGEELLDDFRFDTVVTRAVGSIHKLCTWLGPHFHSIGRVLAIKGPRWVEERGEARHLGSLKGLQMRRLSSYPIGPDSEGVILQILKPRPGA